MKNGLLVSDTYPETLNYIVSDPVTNPNPGIQFCMKSYWESVRVESERLDAMITKNNLKNIRKRITSVSRKKRKDPTYDEEALNSMNQMSLQLFQEPIS